MDQTPPDETLDDSALLAKLEHLKTSFENSLKDLRRVRGAPPVDELIVGDGRRTALFRGPVVVTVVVVGLALAGVGYEGYRTRQAVAEASRDSRDGHAAIVKSLDRSGCVQAYDFPGRERMRAALERAPAEVDRIMAVYCPWLTNGSRVPQRDHR